MKLKSIYIDGMHNVIAKTYEFNDLVYLFGRNGAGKSTVLQAIQFALLGYIPGTAKNSKEALLRHSPSGSMTVRLTVCDVEGTSDPVYIERVVNKNGNKLNIFPSTFDLGEVIKELELPIFNFNEFIGQTANKLKEYFIKHILPTTDGQLDWSQILTESIIDCNFQDRAAIIQYGMGIVNDLEGSLLDQVVSANTKFKEEQSFNKNELQRLQNTIDSLIYYDDYTGPTNIDVINAKIAALSALRDQVLKYNTAMFTLQTQKMEQLELESHIKDIGGQEGYIIATDTLKTVKAMQDAINSKISDLKAKLAECAAAKAVADDIINSYGCCPFTKTACDSLLSRMSELQGNLELTRAKETQLAEEIHRLNNELTEHRSHISRLEANIADYQNATAKLAAITKTMDSAPVKPNTDKELIDIDAELASLNQSLMKIHANARYNETIENITSAKYELELRGRALAAWVKKTDTNGLQTTLMLAPFDELADTMTGYIRQMYGNDELTAHFNVSTKANSFSFGLIRNNTYIPYDLLSSGEKCLYTLALMICIVNKSESPLKLLLCDDMFDHLDSVAVENIFAALKQVTDVQFIFAGVKDCKNAEDVMIRI